jgi:outer membrane protein
MKSIFCIGVLFLALSANVWAQKTLDLEQCLQTAVAQNLQVKLNENALEIAELTHVQKKFEFLPTVSASLPINSSFGKTADLYTQQIASSLTQSNPNLMATFVAFRGLSKWNDLKGAEYNHISSRYSLEDLKNDIRLNTALAFFQAVFASDNLKIARNRIALLEQQMEKLKSQIAAGTKTEGDFFTLKAQLATERVNEITQENAYNRGLLDLVLLLNLPTQDTYTLERPAILDTEVGALEDAETIFESARLNNPGILKQEFKALSTKYAINTARAAYFPTLNLSGGFTSFYSSNAKPRTGYTIVDGFPSFTYGDPTPAFQQLNSNFSKTIALNLSVPIFNRLATRQNYLISKVNYENAELNLQSEQLDLYKSITQAHLDAHAADAKYVASQDQMESIAESYRYAEARYNAGLLDHYAFMEVLNSKTKAEIEQLQSLYDRMLKRKILDLYEGKPIHF